MRPRLLPIINCLALLLVYSIIICVSTGIGTRYSLYSRSFIRNGALIHTSRGEGGLTIDSIARDHRQQHSHNHNHGRRPLGMSSVGAGGSTKPVPSKKTMVISPSTEGSVEEQRIIDNFNQIQFGERKKYGIIGTQDLSESHQNLIELLSYALVLSGNHIYTSGGSSGTNIAVIRGALRACNPDLLTVILPQSLSLQPPEMQLLLSRVADIVQLPQNDDMDLKEAANICNEKIILSVDKMVVFVYHASTSILNPLEVYQETMEFVTFYLD